MTKQQFEAAKAKVQANGPDRMIVDAQGLATTWPRASIEYGTLPEVIFIRNDGWSLGAPYRFREVAQGLWSETWVAQAEFPFENWVMLRELED